MSSLSPKDRVSLCLFTFTDGRRCRTPRTSRHPHFCFYHAQKEARAQAAEKLGKDLAYFFSGDYLSACDLSTALSRLIPAVVRGDIKPKLARTVAYMVQTLMQTIHLSQDEYINAFETDGWRKAVRTSVNANHDYLFPPDADNAGDAEPGLQQPQPQQPQPRQPQPAQPAAETPVGAGLARPTPPAAQPATPPTPQPRSASRSPVPCFRPAPVQLRHNPPAPLKPVILSVAKDPATIPPHRPPTRPASLRHLLNPHNPTTHLRPHHQARNPGQRRQPATPTPSTSTTTTASA